mgnify:CR=1 FL=1
MKSWIHRFDSAIMSGIANWSVSLKPFFLAITTLGDPIVTVGIGIVVAVYGYFQTNMRLVISAALIWVTLGFGAILKLLFGRDRPDTEYANNLHFATNSFPSGHASGAMVAYGLLAYMAWRLLPQPWSYIVVVLLGVLIVLVGLSRIYLGAHFPSDVIAGWALGGVTLLVILFVIRPLS